MRFFGIEAANNISWISPVNVTQGSKNSSRERERGVRQQLEEEEEPIEFVTVFSDIPSFSPLILFISSSIPGH
jgi:hypothetical protein